MSRISGGATGLGGWVRPSRSSSSESWIWNVRSASRVGGITGLAGAGSGLGALATDCRTSRMSDVVSNGLVTWASAPTRAASFLSNGSNVPTSRMTGIWRRWGVRLTNSHTS